MIDYELFNLEQFTFTEMQKRKINTGPAVWMKELWKWEHSIALHWKNTRYCISILRKTDNDSLLHFMEQLIINQYIVIYYYKVRSEAAVLNQALNLHCCK